jgi:hypothetical protein
VAGYPGSGIAPPPGYYPGALIGLVFFLATEGEAELERRAGGPIAQNITHTYALTPDERLYLAGLGVDAGPLLDAMNARRNIAALPEPRNYVEHFADYSGLIKHPVLTLHTTVDEVVPVASESAYRNTIAAVGRGNLLVQVYTTGIGHGSFTAGQYLAAIRAIDGWAQSGTPPASSAFPTEDGFIPDFVPPAWPQP